MHKFSDEGASPKIKKRSNSIFSDSVLVSVLGCCQIPDDSWKLIEFLFNWGPFKHFNNFVDFLRKKTLDLVDTSEEGTIHACYKFEFEFSFEMLSQYGNPDSRRIDSTNAGRIRGNDPEPTTCKPRGADENVFSHLYFSESWSFEKIYNRIFLFSTN